VTVALIAGVAMFAGDVLQALYVILLARGRSTLAGCFDGFADITQVLSIGGGAVAVYHHRIGFDTYLTLLLILAGLIGGAVVGDRLSARVTGKPPITQSATGGI
jgi:hypothetical protein